MKVVICSSEMVPYVKTGGLADVSGALPIALEKVGVEPVIFLPKYKAFNENKFPVQKLSKNLYVTYLNDKIPVYLIEHKKYFERKKLYGHGDQDYRDNLERFKFFARKVLDALKEQKIKADIIHCHDWQTALIPVYLKEEYARKSFYKKLKSVLTIHNLAFQGVFPRSKFSRLGLKDALFSMQGLEFYDKINFLKGGIIYSDKVTTVSKRYAREMKTPEFGCGLHDVIRLKTGKIEGIVNGIDTDIWNPRSDKYLPQSYGPADYKEGKAANKLFLQKQFGLKQDAKICLAGIVTRLAHQKGVDVLLDFLKKNTKWNFQILIQGAGDKKCTEQFKTLARKNRGRLAFYGNYDEKLAHQIYAASDLFLMPSRFEPCGLSQLISLRYGTIPVVSKTGGLVDTIKPFVKNARMATGFMSEDVSEREYVKTFRRALRVYRQKNEFDILVQNAFKANFGWDSSAKKYKKLYQWMLSE